MVARIQSELPNLVEAYQRGRQFKEGREDRASQRGFLQEQRQRQRQQWGQQDEDRSILQKNLQQKKEMAYTQDVQKALSYLDTEAPNFAEEAQMAKNWLQSRHPDMADDLNSIPIEELPPFVRQAQFQMRIGREPVEAKEKPTTQLAKLIDEQSKHPEGSPQWDFYQNKIIKETTAKGGETIRSLPGGGFEIIRGDGGRDKTGELEKSVKAKVQQGILDTTDNIARISEIESLYKPEFQTIGPRLNVAYLAAKEKAGVPLDQQDQSILEDFSAYKASAGQTMADLLNKLSGAAVSEGEAKRAETFIPKVGTGIFDGDSPSQIQSKIKRFKKFNRRATARLNYIDKHGMSIGDIQLSSIDGLIDKRGGELEREIKSETPNITGQELDNAVRQQLADEFGLVF
jgi:hypothetical protein